jgi:hypothetical protein
MPKFDRSKFFVRHSTIFTVLNFNVVPLSLGSLSSCENTVLSTASIIVVHILLAPKVSASDVELFFELIS